MLSKCANPLCSAPFRTLKKGRLVVLHLRDPVLEAIPAERGARDFEPFWLCEGCCDRFTVLVRPGRECVCVPRPSGKDASSEELDVTARAVAVPST